MKQDYWLKQSHDQALFPDIEWNKPEQKSQAGKLAIIGGSRLGFVAVHDAYKTAQEHGAGQIRAILPDALQKTVPTSVSDTLFLPSNPTGGFSREAIDEFASACSWADVCLLVGDTGRNSETAMSLESLIEGTSELVVTRDAIDLLMPAAQKLVDRERTTLILSFAQLQKMFSAIYYPKILSFSMQLMQLVDTLHKFTITYPVTVVTFHQSQLIVAYDGRIVTQAFDQPMAIWRGITAARAASYLLWNRDKRLEAIVTSFR